MSRGLLPIFVDVEGVTIVVTGNGTRSQSFARRASALGANVKHVEGAPQAGHLDGARLLVAGSEDATADAAILAAARERGVLSIDLSGGGDAHLGTSAGDGSVQIAATTCGRSPELEVRLATEASHALRPEHERLTGILAAIRPKLEGRFADEALRAAIWQQILDSPVVVLLESGLDDEALEMAERMAWGTG